MSARSGNARIPDMDFSPVNAGGPDDDPDYGQRVEEALDALPDLTGVFCLPPVTPWDLMHGKAPLN
jgi:hypothetical protein